jgi:crossover junction endodeoxyribonuclease RusA
MIESGFQDTVELPWPGAELSPNSRCHWRVKARVGKDYKRTVYYSCKEAGLICPKCSQLDVYVDFHPPSRHINDKDNLVGRSKFLMDSLAEYLHMNDRDFIPHWGYPAFDANFKGKVVVKIMEHAECVD